MTCYIWVLLCSK